MSLEIPLGVNKVCIELYHDDCEATREARMLQAPMKGRKISAVEGRVAILLGTLHAKETWISSGRLGLRVVCAFTFLVFLTLAYE